MTPWENSIDYKRAKEAWGIRMTDPEEKHIEFMHSQEFANARLTYRRRINNCPDGETT